MIRKIIKILFMSMKILIFFLGIIFFFLISVFVLFGEKECVRLPNGIIVSDDSNFNFTQCYFLSNVVVKGPDGRIFSRGNDDLFYFSETTAWWVDNHPGYSRKRREKLAYRPDVGLVSAWNNPTLYEQLKREAGTLLEEGKKLRNTNVSGVLHFLLRDPKYYSRDCGVPLFTFEKSYP